jgi:hypothetical protein
MVLLQSFVDMQKTEKNVSGLTHTLPGEVKQGYTLHSVLGSLVSTRFFSFLCFFFVVSLLEMTPKCSAQVLSGVPEHLKAILCLMEKIHVLDKLCLDMSYSIAGTKFHVDESATYVK